MTKSVRITKETIDTMCAVYAAEIKRAHWGDKAAEQSADFLRKHLYKTYDINEVSDAHN